MTYKYYLTHRGVAPGCQPGGFISWEDTPDGELTTGKRCYGFVLYSRELTQEEISEYELTPHGEGVRLREHKPFDGWRKFADKTGNGSYYDYAKPGDIVDQETMDYFMNVLPPHEMGRGYLQMGEAFDAKPDKDGRLKNVYMTFAKIDGKCYYLGTCFDKGWEHVL